jgi:hypothetical protein
MATRITDGRSLLSIIRQVADLRQQCHEHSVLVLDGLQHTPQLPHITPHLHDVLSSKYCSRLPTQQSPIHQPGVPSVRALYSAIAILHKQRLFDPPQDMHDSAPAGQQKLRQTPKFLKIKACSAVYKVYNSGTIISK